MHQGASFPLFLHFLDSSISLLCCILGHGGRYFGTTVRYGSGFMLVVRSGSLVFSTSCQLIVETVSEAAMVYRW